MSFPRWHLFRQWNGVHCWFKYKTTSIITNLCFRYWIQSLILAHSMLDLRESHRGNSATMNQDCFWWSSSWHGHLWRSVENFGQWALKRSSRDQSLKFLWIYMKQFLKPYETSITFRPLAFLNWNTSSYIGQRYSCELRRLKPPYNQMNGGWPTSEAKASLPFSSWQLPDFAPSCPTRDKQAIELEEHHQ